jgi:hypothetical protein
MPAKGAGPAPANSITVIPAKAPAIKPLSDRHLPFNAYWQSVQLGNESDLATATR